jgi:hypothetical protein
MRSVPAIAFFLCFLQAYAQPSASQNRQSFPVRYFNSIFRDTTGKEKSQLLIYPILAYAPETSVELGASVLYVRYARNDTNNRLSEINGTTFYTIRNQFGALFDHALYSHRNNWFLLGKMKLQSFPLSYYGIGPETGETKLARVDALQFQIKERVLRKVHGNFYAGLEADLQHIGNVDFIDHEPSVAYEKPFGHNGSTNFGLGLGALYDNRHNVLNVRKGFFSELAFLHYSPAIGSDHDFTSVFFDTRWFTPIRKRNVFAAQLLSQFTYGDAPFNQLALMGGESMMRGYYLGRYRDRNLTAAQAEYRMLPFPFAKRWGAAVFAGAGAVYNDYASLKKQHIVFAGGGGLRFQLFPKKDVWVRADIAFTREGTGLYIFVGEAF